VTTNLDRRIKRRVHAPYHEVRVLGPIGLAETCAAEAREIAARFLHQQDVMPEVRVEEGGVFLSGVDFRNLLQLGYEMKTARDLLWVVHRRRTGSKGALAETLDGVEWDVLLPRGAEVAVRVSSRRSRLYHEGMIEDVFTEVIKNRGFRPSAKGAAANLVDLRLDRDELVVSLSLSGGDLFRRGFKKRLVSVASMKEDLAACATLWTEAFARQQGALSDEGPVKVLVPFAGSGTLGFESALRFGRLPLSMLSRVLAFERFPCTPATSLKHIRAKLQEASASARGFELRFAELEAAQCEALRENSAAFFKAIGGESDRRTASVTEANVFESDAWISEPSGDAFVPLNPPYGIRLTGIDTGPGLYKRAGEWTRRAAAGGWVSFSGYVFAPDGTTAAAFIAEIPGFETRSLEVRHGGRKVTLIGFVRT
jgi:putative N6-adenine-specific DNA methylase